jgi:putative ABC transport system permease protein
LTVLSIAISVALLLSVEKTKRSSEEGFTQTISQTDLIVGAKSSPINLLLYTVFNMGSPTNNVSVESWEKFKNLPQVEWTIPYSLGDGHKGFRVVGTDLSFFEHYRFRKDQALSLHEGKVFSQNLDAVLGAEVAQKLGYEIGDKITLSHGVTKTEGFINHDDHPFTVTGILNATGTALDRAVYISLLGLEEIHRSSTDSERSTTEASDAKAELQPKAITAFFVRTTNRIEVLNLQRAINEFEEEPLMAIIPSVALNELWMGLSHFEKALKGIAWLVVFSGLVSMLIALLASIGERRREMSILRSLGATLQQVASLLVIESALLTALGVLLGVVLQTFSFWIIGSYLETHFGLYAQGFDFNLYDFVLLLVTFIMGTLLGLIPAWRTMKLALKDGLTVRI